MDRRVEALHNWFSKYVDIDYNDVLRYYRLTDHIRMVTPIDRFIEYMGLMAGIVLDKDLVNRIADEYINSTLSFKPKVAVEAAEALETISGLGYRVGVLTNTSLNEVGVWGLLSNVGLDKYVDVVVSSCDIGCIKPSSDAFIHVADKLGIGIGSLMHVGDSYLDDVVGAVSVGARGVLYTGLWNRYQNYSGFRKRPRVTARLDAPVIDDLRKIYIKIL